MNWKGKVVSTIRGAVGRPPCEVVNWKNFGIPKGKTGAVDLLVRSWIERKVLTETWLVHQSTSLWGRELKDHNCCNFSILYRRPPCEVVNWKMYNRFRLYPLVRRPPCEVVNWKFIEWLFSYANLVDLLVRSWIERDSPLLFDVLGDSRPPCEVVNWKINVILDYALEEGSTSLWGRELKECCADLQIG